VESNDRNEESVGIGSDRIGRNTRCHTCWGWRIFASFRCFGALHAGFRLLQRCIRVPSNDWSFFGRTRRPAIPGWRMVFISYASSGEPVLGQTGFSSHGLWLHDRRRLDRITRQCGISGQYDVGDPLATALGLYEFRYESLLILVILRCHWNCWLNPCWPQVLLVKTSPRQ
jgi:hypothetical protein